VSKSTFSFIWCSSIVNAYYINFSFYNVISRLVEKSGALSTLINFGMISNIILPSTLSNVVDTCGNILKVRI